MKNNVSIEFTTKVATLRLARLVNALTFCELVRTKVSSFENQEYFCFKWKHAAWLMGGYLYEAVHLIDDLSENFGGSRHFRELMQFAAYTRPYRELLAEMNTNPSFTMDWGGGTSERECEAVHFTAEGIAADRSGTNPRVQFYDEAWAVDAKWAAMQVMKFMPIEQANEIASDGLDLFSKMFRLAAVRFIEGQVLGRTHEDLEEKEV